MDQKTREQLVAAAKRCEALGPYHAIATVEAICEDADLSAREKIDRIRYLLGLLVSEREEGMA